MCVYLYLPFFMPSRIKLSKFVIWIKYLSGFPSYKSKYQQHSGLLCVYFYLHSQQGAHGHYQQRNCNDVGCISWMELEFQILMIGQHDFHHFSIGTNDEVDDLLPPILATNENRISMPLICFYLSFCTAKNYHEKKNLKNYSCNAKFDVFGITMRNFTIEI